MRVTSTIGAGLLSVVGAVALSTVTATGATAQSMTPMRGEVKSFSDNFAIRVNPQNPYQHRIRIEVKVYDETFAPVPALISPAEMMLGPEGNRSVTVLVPFEGRKERRVRVCTESVPYTNSKTSRVRTQICGRFIAHRLS